MILCTHRELLERKPGWALGLEDGDCSGVLHLEDLDMEIWTAVCDICGLQVGVPPRQQDVLVEQMRQLAGRPPRRRPQ